MGDLDDAINHYEQALRHNQWSIPAMNAISCILRTKEQLPRAIEYLQNILKLDPSSGETWGSLGHCHLMMDNLQDAYTSYQQALYYLHDPKVSSSLHISSTILVADYTCLGRNPSCGMELVSCMIAMTLWIMPKRLSRES